MDRFADRTSGGPAVQSGRHLLQTFAAHIAWCLNGKGETFELNAGSLYKRLLDTLAGDDGRGRSRYLTGLIGIHLLGQGMGPEEAAAQYFERVLNRPLHLAPAKQHHKAHDVLLSLCRRSVVEGWGAAELIRRHATSPPAVHLPDEVRTVSDRLAGMRDRHGALSPGNPARAMRDRYGSLFLHVAGQSLEVPEELSLWEAIQCAPTLLHVLPVGTPFNRFCSLMIRTLETANRPYGTLIGIGLSPLAWGEAVSVHTAKQISAFLADTRTLAAQCDGMPLSLEIWEEVWRRRPMPNFRSAQEFWASPLGHALRAGGVSIPAFGGGQGPEEEDDTELLAPDALATKVQQAVQKGVFDAFDAWLIAQLSKGHKFEQLRYHVRVLARFGRTQIPEAYKQDLLRRVQKLE